MRLRDKSVVLVWMSGGLYILLSFLLSAFYLINVDKAPFVATIWAATLTAIASLFYAWTAYITNVDTKHQLLLGYIVLLLSLYLFYLEPIIYGGSSVHALKSVMPATAQLLETLSIIPTSHKFALYWGLSLFTPLVIFGIVIWRIKYRA